MVEVKTERSKVTLTILIKEKEKNTTSTGIGLAEQTGDWPTRQPGDEQHSKHNRQ